MRSARSFRRATAFATALFALAALGLFLGSALGLIPWLTIEARFGETALPDAGAWLEGAVAVLYVVVVLIAANNLGRRGILLVSAACVLLAIGSYVFAHGLDHVHSS